MLLLYETYLQAFSYFRIGYGSALTMLFIAFVGGISALQMWATGRSSAISSRVPPLSEAVAPGRLGWWQIRVPHLAQNQQRVTPPLAVGRS